MYFGRQKSRNRPPSTQVSSAGSSIAISGRDWAAARLVRWIITTPELALTIGNDDVALEALSRGVAIGEQLAECSRTTKETRRWEDGETSERFTDRARRVLVLVQEEARLFNHGFIGTEHILLGLIHEGEGVAAKALALLDISLTAGCARVEETIGIVTSAPSASPPFTPRAKKVLELFLREALQLGHIDRGRRGRAGAQGLRNCI